MTKIKLEVELAHQQCINCGTHFGVDAYLDKLWRKNGQTFYCPNGHSQHYIIGKTNEQKIKELEAQLQEAETDKRYLNNSLESTRRSLSATKGVLTRTKNRIHKGICPVCNRQFMNLHRHMEGQHPNYLEQAQ
jgi:Zn finger protein HypA/HybF involved in hydrogenase expression